MSHHDPDDLLVSRVVGILILCAVAVSWVAAVHFALEAAP